ncbi:MAG: hypothetical protein RBS56_03280 [Candidatus Gracilibacteria bacterium]|jgi:hypothetical protein|nr:hypothetical protein [Candidatus Gracilibacteria bacterium]
MEDLPGESKLEKQFKAIMAELKGTKYKFYRYGDGYTFVFSLYNGLGQRKVFRFKPSGAIEEAIRIVPEFSEECEEISLDTFLNEASKKFSLDRNELSFQVQRLLFMVRQKLNEFL